MTATQALRQCIEAMKLVDFKDCGESEALWKQINDAQANAERVLRENKESEIWHVQQLRAAVADSMWHDHAEVSKSLLTGAANIIEAAAARIAALKAAVVLRDGEKQEPIGYVTTMAWPETGTVFNTSRVVSKETADACAKQWRSQSRDYKVEVIAVYTHPAPSLQSVVELPEATDEMAMAVRHYDVFDILPDAALKAVAKDIFKTMLAAAPQPPAAPSGDAMPVSVRALTDNLLIAVDNLGHAEGGLEGLDQLHSAARHLRRGLGE